MLVVSTHSFADKIAFDSWRKQHKSRVIRSGDPFEINLFRQRLLVRHENGNNNSRRAVKMHNLCIS